MSGFSVSEDVRELISDIIAKKSWKLIDDVKYSPGTEAGEGYASKHVAVEIPTDTRIIKLFVKYALFTGAALDSLPIAKFYGTEAYFYEKVYPVYRDFAKEKCGEEFFNIVPKCLGTSTKHVIVLEDIKSNGYRLFDRTKPMDEEHIVVTLKTFAKFHATSFALKDQRRKEYDSLVDGWNGDFLKEHKKDSPAIKLFTNSIYDGLQKLDPVGDKEILERCDVDKLIDVFMHVGETVDEYSILTQGDCWCNNVMYLYENVNEAKLKNVMLVDWQLLRPTSPVFDISYFFYTIATPEALLKLEFYLEIYYKELRRLILEFGSNPDIIYPENVFRDEWMRHCKYGFVMAFVIVKFMLLNADEVPKMENIDLEKLKDADAKVELFHKFDNEAKYIERIRALARFMIDNDYV